MLDERPSRTAYRVALRRAAHQVFDDPVIFRDPFALRLLGLSADRLGPTDLRAPNRPSSQSLRAFLVARSLFAEEALATAFTGDGVTQYVLLGAGLDTFAQRNPHPALRVFEVDHPATQRWKQRLLQEAGLSLNATHVPVDFERDDLEACLRHAGLRDDQPTMFAMLGVVPYLTGEAFAGTLAMLARRPSSTAVVMDYGLPRHALPPLEQLAFDSLAERVAQAGEPFRLWFTPETLSRQMDENGMRVMETLHPETVNERYFAERGSLLRVRGTGARMALVQSASGPFRSRA